MPHQLLEDHLAYLDAVESGQLKVEDAPQNTESLDSVGAEDVVASSPEQVQVLQRCQYLLDAGQSLDELLPQEQERLAAWLEQSEKQQRRADIRAWRLALSSILSDQEESQNIEELLKDPTYL